MKKVITIIMTILLAVSLKLTIYAVETPVETEAVTEIETPAETETEVKTEQSTFPEGLEPSETHIFVPGEEEITIPEITIPLPEIDTSGVPEETHNLFNRMYEFVVEHKNQIISTLPDLVLLLIACVWKQLSKKAKFSIENRIKGLENSTSQTLSGQQNEINAVNNMIDGYNKVMESNDKLVKSNEELKLKEDARNKLAGAELITNIAILETINTVYSQSKNLPQGVKDIINLKYAKCLQALEDDDKLREVVSQVRKNIAEDAVEPSEDNKESEV